MCMCIYECRTLWVAQRSWESLELQLQVIMSCQNVGVGNRTWVLGKSRVHSNWWTISTVLWRRYHFMHFIRHLFIVTFIQLFENSENSVSYCCGILFQPQAAASQYIQYLLRSRLLSDLHMESLYSTPFLWYSNLQILFFISWRYDLCCLNSDKLLINMGSVATGNPVPSSTRWCKC